MALFYYKADSADVKCKLDLKRELPQPNGDLTLSRKLYKSKVEEVRDLKKKKNGRFYCCLEDGGRYMAGGDRACGIQKWPWDGC